MCIQIRLGHILSAYVLEKEWSPENEYAKNTGGPVGLKTPLLLN